MIRYKRSALLFAAGILVAAGSAWADDKPMASASPMPTARPMAKSGKQDSPTVAAMKAANALADSGKTDEAIAAYEKMGVLKSKKMEAWRLNNEALVYLQVNKPDKALPLLQKSTESDATNYIAWNNLGSAYEATGDTDKAKDAYQKSIDAAKDANASSAKAEGNLAALNARLGATGGKGGAAKDDSADSDDSKPDAGAAKK